MKNSKIPSNLGYPSKTLQIKEERGNVHTNDRANPQQWDIHTNSDGPFALRKVGAGLYGVLKSEFQTHEVGIVPNFDFSDLSKFRLKRK